MGMPGTWVYFHSLICHVFGQSTAAEHPPAPSLVSGTLGRVLCCLLPSPNTVFSFLTYDRKVSPLLSFVAPHHCLFSPQFFFCLRTLLGGHGQRVFSFLRDWLRPITFGGKSTRNSDQLQAAWEEHRNRRVNQQYFWSPTDLQPSEVGAVLVLLRIWWIFLILLSDKGHFEGI